MDHGILVASRNPVQSLREIEPSISVRQEVQLVSTIFGRCFDLSNLPVYTEPHALRCYKIWHFLDIGRDRFKLDVGNRYNNFYR